MLGTVLWLNHIACLFHKYFSCGKMYGIWYAYCGTISFWPSVFVDLTYSISVCLSRLFLFHFSCLTFVCCGLWCWYTYYSFPLNFPSHATGPTMQRELRNVAQHFCISVTYAIHVDGFSCNLVIMTLGCHHNKW